MDAPTRAPPLINPHALMARGTAWRVAYLVPRLSLTNPIYAVERQVASLVPRRSLHGFVFAMAGRVDPLVP